MLFPTGTRSNVEATIKWGIYLYVSYEKEVYGMDGISLHSKKIHPFCGEGLKLIKLFLQTESAMG